jgi:hypothetical protein
MTMHGSPLSRVVFCASLMALLGACGGGGGGSAPAPATGLSYTADPTATTADWRVEADPATNGTQTVVLKFYGPAGTAIQGATVFLSSDSARAAWVKPTGAADPYALQGSALDLSQGPNTSLQLFKSHLAGSSLQVAAYQKSGTTVLAADQPLFSVAVNLKPGATPGSAILSATPSRTAIYLDGTGEHPLTMKLGTLSAN